MILNKIAETKKKNFEEKIVDIMPKTPGRIYQQIKDKENLFVIGEIKKASPSKGIIIEDFDVTNLAKQYHLSKIDAISVLTEENYFLGNKEYLKEVRTITQKPILRKDFIIDPREIIEAKILGADLILLIVALLSDKELREFYMMAYALGLECIVEVHDQEELNRAMKIKPEIIGINNRNLKTFDVTLETTKKLMCMIPDNIAVISESGIHKKEDVEFVQACGVDGLLIGESFMKAKSIEEHYQFLGLNHDC